MHNNQQYFPDKGKVPHRIAKGIAKGAVFSFGGTFAGWIIEYLIRVLLARHLGSYGYGLISLSVAVIAVAGSIALVGMESGITRSIAYFIGKNDMARAKGTIYAGFKIVTFLSIILGFLVFFSTEKISTIFFHDRNLASVLRIFSLFLPFFCIFSVWVAIFRGFKKIKYMVYVNTIFNSGVRLIILSIIILLGAGILKISIGYCIGWISGILAAIVIFLHMIKRYKNWRTLEKIEEKRKLFVFSLPLVISHILGRIRSKTDTLLIGYFITPVEVGIYNIALPLSKILLVALNSINRIFTPSITELYSKGNIVELKNTYKRVARWAFYITFPIFLVLVCYSRYILINLFGIQYQSATLPLIILSAGMFINAISGSFGETIIAIGKTKVNMMLILIFVFVNIILNIILIPKFSIIGAAWANAISLAIVCTAGLLYLYKQLGLQPFSMGHLKFFFVSSISLLIIHFCFKFLLPKISFWFFPVFVIILYLVSFYGLFLLKGIDEVELAILRSILKKFKR